MSKSEYDKGALFLSAEEAAEVRELVAEVKAARKEAKEARDKHDGWTKEKIMAVPDIRERQKLIKEHMDLFI